MIFLKKKHVIPKQGGGGGVPHLGKIPTFSRCFFCRRPLFHQVISSQLGKLFPIMENNWQIAKEVLGGAQSQNLDLPAFFCNKKSKTRSNWEGSIHEHFHHVMSGKDCVAFRGKKKMGSLSLWPWLSHYEQYFFSNVSLTLSFPPPSSIMDSQLVSAWTG